MASGTPFRQRLDTMPDLGQGDGWTDQQWRQAPTRRVRLADLIATNRGRFLDEERIDRYRWWPPLGPPYVVEHHGRLYLADGHHRVTAAWRRGETRIRARVLRPT